MGKKFTMTISKVLPLSFIWRLSKVQLEALKAENASKTPRVQIDKDIVSTLLDPQLHFREFFLQPFKESS